MKRVFSSHNLQLLHHKNNLLRAEGIAAEIRNQYLSSAVGELPPAETEAQLWVEDRDEARAKEILNRVVTGPDWTCACGEVLGAQFAQCWNCGALRA